MGRMKIPEKRWCLVCEEEFITIINKKRCCSQKCGHLNWLSNNLEHMKTYQREWNKLQRETDEAYNERHRVWQRANYKRKKENN